MTSSKKKIRLAILGAGGIGKVHARIFHKLGVDICAVLGSTKESSQKVAQSLNSAYGIQAQPFDCLEILLKKTKPDAVSICTPPKLHFEQIISAFNDCVAVFCEKPLFWEDNMTPLLLEKKLALIKNHSYRRLYVNTSNASLVDTILPMLENRNKINSFIFRFFTQGRNQYQNIAVDLLPHACSLLLKLLPSSIPQQLKQKIAVNHYSCSFDYGNCLVKFDFQEQTNGPKLFEFIINRRCFTRVQKGDGDTYKVYLHDSLTKSNILTDDPFVVYIKKFIVFCKNGILHEKDQFNEAASNMRLMTKILFNNYD